MFPPPPTPLNPSSKSDEVKRVIFCQKTTKKEPNIGIRKILFKREFQRIKKKEHNKNKNPKSRKEQDNDNRKTER